MKRPNYRVQATPDCTRTKSDVTGGWLRWLTFTLAINER
jgi:hypothetical protein